MTKSEAGRIGGMRKSDAKSAAVKKNGKKGGRPRKIVKIELNEIEKKNELYNE